MNNLSEAKTKSSVPLSITVFGGSGVIGRAIATEFGRRNWSVGVHYHYNQATAWKTAVDIQNSKGHARLYQADVNDPLQIRTFFQSFLHDCGGLKILVWAVGVAPSKLLLKTSPEDWALCLHTNLTGAFHVLREAGPIFKQQQEGAVILVGSLSGEQGMAGQAAYAASKAGLIGLMRTTAKEWAPWNIRVNAIFPGWHSSRLSASGKDVSFTQQTHILQRRSSLNSVAESVYHLALAQGVSGQIWNLDSRIW